jgi:tetratricopeptide (TPR) repeat protein
VGSPRFLLGGSKRLLDKGAVRISDVRIHRLEVERPDGESTDASAWRSYYESIVAFDTGDSHALLELASLYAAAEEWPRAASCLKKASENGPFSFERVDLLLTISMATSNFVDAKPMIEAAMERFPEQPEYAEMMTWICATASDEKLRDAQRAVELATRLVKNEHSLSWKGHRAIAAAFAENENFAEAVLQMEQALTKGPESQKEEISAMLRQLTEKQPIRTTPSE